jgi:hypothetical protein
MFQEGIFMRNTIRHSLFGLLIAAGLALAPSAFARGHVSVGIGLPGISLGFSDCRHCGHGGWGGNYYGGVGYYGGGYYSGYAAPVYYSPAYYEPSYYSYPSYGAVYYGGGGYYSDRYYGRGRHDGYRGGYRGRDGHHDRGDYGHRASYYDRSGYRH